MNYTLRRSGQLADAFRILLFAFICFGAARLGMFFALDTSRISLIWPLTGVSMAALYLLGRKYALGLALAMFVNSLLIGMALPLAVGVACGSALMALFGAYVLKERVDFHPTFDRARDVLTFVAIGVVFSPLISAIVGTTCFYFAGLLSAEVYSFNLFTWWVGDAVGVLLVAPVLLIWARIPFRQPPRHKIIEAVILIVLLETTAWLVFGKGIGGRSLYPLAYLVFPFLVWAALRFDQRMVVSLTLIVSVIAVLETSQEFGSFSQQMVWNSVLFLWAYIATMATTSMLLSAIFTERRQIQQQVRSLETRFTRAFHVAPVAMWMADMETGRFVDVNEEFCTVMGYAREELIGSTAVELNLWESPEARHQIVARLMQEGRISQVEARLSTKGGNKRSVLLALEMMDINGKLHLFGMFHDVTARLEAEAALRENEAHYRQLFEGIDDAIFVHDMDANILDVNEATCRRLGYSREELLSMKVTDLDAPGFASGFAERLRQQLEQGYLNQIEGTQIAKDGQQIFIDVNTKLITYRGQRAVFAVDRDITERKLSEQKLRDSEVRYRAIIEDQTDMICRLTPDWTLNFVNNAFCRYHGKTREELVGTIFRPEVYAEDRERVRDMIRALSALNPVITAEYRVLLPHISPDGTPRWHQWTHRAITDEQGQLIEYQFVGRDVTVLKEIETQRLAVTLEHEKVQILADFIAAASHDFRTPLSVINTSAYLLNRLTAEEQRKHHLEQIQEQTTHIERMIDGLLTMSRLDRGDVFRFKPVNLNMTIQQIQLRKSAQVEQKPLSFQLDLDPKLPQIDADNNWIHTAITQVIENAIYFTPPGGSIIVRTCVERDRLLIVVSDTGVGITATDLPHIFKRLYRGEEHRPMGGQGLGLSMVERIIEAHQGRVEVESQPGVGSTFRLLLPLNRSEMPRTDTSAAPLPSL